MGFSVWCTKARRTAPYSGATRGCDDAARPRAARDDRRLPGARLQARRDHRQRGRGKRRKRECARRRSAARRAPTPALTSIRCRRTSCSRAAARAVAPSACRRSTADRRSRACPAAASGPCPLAAADRPRAPAQVAAHEAHQQTGARAATRHCTPSRSALRCQLNRVHARRERAETALGERRRSWPGQGRQRARRVRDGRRENAAGGAEQRSTRHAIGVHRCSEQHAAAKDARRCGSSPGVPLAARRRRSARAPFAYFCSGAGSSSGTSSSASSSTKPGSLSPAPIFSSEARSASNSWP